MKKTDILPASTGETVAIPRAEYEKLLGQGQQLLTQNERISHLENQVELLMEALRLARHKQFSASSEKSEEPLVEQLSFLFNEAEVFAEEKKAEAENVTIVAAHKRHKKHEYTLDNIPEGIETKQVEHRIEDEDLVCPQCGDTILFSRGMHRQSALAYTSAEWTCKSRSISLVLIQNSTSLATRHIRRGLW